jgi:hypothetical protein
MASDSPLQASYRLASIASKHSPNGPKLPSIGWMIFGFSTSPGMLQILRNIVNRCSSFLIERAIIGKQNEELDPFRTAK